MKRTARRSVAALLVSLVATIAVANVQAGATIGLIDVSKQVAKIQSQVDALTRLGQTVKVGVLTSLAVCGQETLAPVFGPWNDASLYALAPSGAFETSTGWVWDPGSKIVADNSQFSIGSHALFLGTKGTAASPSVCVTTQHPTIRFFAKNTGSSDSLLTVSVLYQGVDGKVQQLKVATIAATPRWAPTIAIPYHMNLIAAASQGGTTAVSFVFQVTGSKGTNRTDASGWTIDDLYVDPIKNI